jgi:predicted acylesterase/phospholipase RssA
MRLADAPCRYRPDLALALGGVGWSALACLPLLAWLDANRVRPGVMATTGFATLPAALWAIGMPAGDIARRLAEHLPNQVFRRRDPMPLLSMIGIPLRDRGLPHALWRSGPLQAACARLFEDARLETMPVPLHVTLIDCLTGQFHSMANGRLAAAAYASTALLPALPPLRIDGRWMGDASAYHAAPLSDLLLRPGLRHVIAATCSFPPPARYASLVDQQLTLQMVLQKAALKTSALLALDLLEGELVLLAARLQRSVDPFDVAMIPDAIAAGERELARWGEQIEQIQQDAHV